MSLLNANQRAIVVADTQIDPLIVDRATEAFDALIKGDVDTYRVLMATAYAQMGYMPRAQDRPHAVDKVKTILIRAYADELHIPFGRAARRLRDMTRG